MSFNSLIVAFCALGAFSNATWGDDFSNNGELSEKQSSPVKASTGPTGYGPIKIGMSKISIEKLTSSDGVYFPNGLVHKGRFDGLPGVDEYYGEMTILGVASKINVNMGFAGDQLSVLAFSFGNNGLPDLRLQVSEKYGPGTVLSEGAIKYCKGKNGKKIEIKPGLWQKRWYQPVSSYEQIVTSIVEFVGDSCLTNPKGELEPPISNRVISIEKEIIPGAIVPSLL